MDADLRVAFDPGTRHLGVCALSPDGSVVAWSSVDVSDGAIGFCRAMDELEPIIRRASTVVIERQPPLNRAALRIQHWLELVVFRHNPDCRVIIMNAQTRVAHVRRQRPDLEFSTYARRKRSSVEYVRDLIRGTPAETTFERARKKDDLAEAYVMATMAS